MAILLVTTGFTCNVVCAESDEAETAGAAGTGVSAADDADANADADSDTGATTGAAADNAGTPSDTTDSAADEAAAADAATAAAEAEAEAVAALVEAITADANAKATEDDGANTADTDAVSDGAAADGAAADDAALDDAAVDGDAAADSDSASDDAASFPDVATHWAKIYIDELCEMGILAGMGDGLFHPDDTVTVAEFIAMVIKSVNGTLAPTGEHWSSVYYDVAIDYEIAGDYEVTNRDRPIPRRKVATIGHLALSTIFNEADETDVSAAESLSDLNDCGECVPHISQFYVKGIMIGYPDGYFRGSNSLTRAEAAVVIIKMLKPEMREPQSQASVNSGDEGANNDGNNASGGTDGIDNDNGDDGDGATGTGAGAGASTGAGNTLAGHENDMALFAETFPVSDDHPFVFATFEEVTARLKSGTGVVAFAFPACPRCKNAFPVLEKTFKEMNMGGRSGLDGKILYYDIFDDREENNERYQTLVSLTKAFLPEDDDGNPRIYSPDIFFVSSGKIVGHHLDTVPSLTNPLDKLNDEQAAELSEIYKELFWSMLDDCGC